MNSTASGTQHWTWEQSEATSAAAGQPTGIVTLWIDVLNRPQNVFSAEVLAELDQLLSRLEQSKGIGLVLFRSRKPHSFFAGADIRDFTQIKTTEEAYQVSERGQTLFQRIESLPMLTIAVIQGVCLGGGLELALACDYRVAVEGAATRLGLPETGLGILPGWGGTQRLPKLIGVSQSIKMILQAQKLTAVKARKVGLVDEVFAAEQLDEQLKKFCQRLLTQKSVVRPGSQRSWLGWFLDRTSFGRTLLVGGTEKRITYQKRHYPALGKALEAIRLSYTDPKRGYDFEREAIAELLFSPTSRNLVQLFLNQERARNPQTWQTSETSAAPRKLQSLAVLGGGTMGAGIAQIAAKNGFQVVLKEINDQAVNTAQERIDQAYTSLLVRKSVTPAEAKQQKEAIHFTIDWEPVRKAEVVIEAVPETLALKKTVFQELTRHTSPETIFATNTSALSVTEIASVVERPERMAGLHFFNPVHRMDLVEVIRGEKSSPETLAQLVQLARQLGKTPIIVNDSPGFVVNRVLMPYLDEAVKIAIERTARGEDVAVIDKEMKKFGMPMGPLELLDQVGMDVAAHVAQSMTVVFGENSITALLLQRMLDEGRLGRKTSHGFYEYHHHEKKHLISIKPLLEGIELDLDSAPATPLDESLTPIQQRLVLAMVNEAGRCLDEKVVTEAWMIDLAMVLGTGFAPFHGGPLSYAQQYPREKILTTLESLQSVYGARYAPADSLVSLLK